MNTRDEGIATRQMEVVGEGSVNESARITTTLFDLIVALQSTVAPHEDALVVVLVLHLLCCGRITWLGANCEKTAQT